MVCKNVIIFGVDTSSSVHVDNNNQDILILGKGPTQGLHDTTLHSVNFSKQGNEFHLSIHYNGSDSYLFVNGVKMYWFKAKDSELIAYPQILQLMTWTKWTKCTKLD